MEERIKQLENQIAELIEWKRQREIQQISAPLDEASKNNLQSPTLVGAGSSSTTQNKNLSGDPQTITVPAAYAGTIVLNINGVQYEIPYL